MLNIVTVPESDTVARFNGILAHVLISCFNVWNEGEGTEKSIIAISFKSYRTNIKLSLITEVPTVADWI